MGRMMLVALQVEGDAAALAAAMETVQRELGRVMGPEVAPALAGGSEMQEHRLKPVPLGISTNGAHPPKQKPVVSKPVLNKGDKAAGAIGMRILRYLVESHDNGVADCTIDEVFRISGAATQESASACLVTLKAKGLVQAGSARGQWQISKQGLAAVAKDKAWAGKTQAKARATEDPEDLEDEDEGDG